ncbi:hypothetical protein GMA19_01619 [Paenibacillus polymyxa E681]|nr:hypothetical protein GE561_01619 [Paenibacillus polymyxa E681]QNV61293.1 hypothetical protein GMA19_01619 [Paenibacillus polymyxa E681]
MKPDELNKIGILESVGTIPKYRKMELEKVVIYGAIKRVKDKGIEYGKKQSCLTLTDIIGKDFEILVIHQFSWGEYGC